MAKEVDSCLELCSSTDHGMPGVPASRIVPYKVTATTKLSEIGYALCAPLDVDHNVMQLSKRAFLSPLLHLDFRGCCQETSVVLVCKSFIVGRKKKGLSCQIDNVAITA